MITCVNDKLSHQDIYKHKGERRITNLKQHRTHNLLQKWNNLYLDYNFEAEHGYQSTN